MSWNFRIMRHKDETGQTYFSMHEVHYDKLGNVEGWTQDECRVFSETVDGMKWSLTEMAKAFDRPVLDFDADSES